MNTTERKVTERNIKQKDGVNENEPPTEVPLDTGDIPKGGGGRLPHPTIDCVLVIRHIVPLRGLGGLGNAGGPVSNGDETGESVVETHLLPT